MSSAATISSRWKRWRHNFDQAGKNSPGRGSFCALPTQIFQQLPQLGLAGEAQPLLDAQGVALRQELRHRCRCGAPAGQGCRRRHTARPRPARPRHRGSRWWSRFPARPAPRCWAGRGTGVSSAEVGTAQREPGPGHPEQAEHDGKNA